MGKTLAERRGDLRALANAYKIPVKLSSGELDQCTEFGKMDVFAAIFPEYAHLFRADLTVTHGDAWVDNFFGLTGRMWISDGAGGELPIRWAHPSEIAMLTRNTRIKGSDTEPVLYTSDRKWYFLSDTTVTGAHLETYYFPVPLSVGTDTDTMPDWSEPMIARSAFEFMLKMMVDQQTALQLNQQEIEHAEQALKQLYEEKFTEINTPDKE